MCQAYGVHKQGCRFGYTKVRGSSPLLATAASTGEVAGVRMRGGSAASAGGAKSFVVETTGPVRDAGATGRLTLRADLAFSQLVRCCGPAARFSLTVRLNKSISAPIVVSQFGNLVV